MHGMIIPLVGNGGQGFSAFHDAFLGFFRRSGDANMAESITLIDQALVGAPDDNP